MKQALLDIPKKFLEKPVTRLADKLILWDMRIFDFAWEQAEECLSDIMKAESRRDMQRRYASYMKSTPKLMLLGASKPYLRWPVIGQLAIGFLRIADWESIAKKLFETCVEYEAFQMELASMEEHETE